MITAASAVRNIEESLICFDDQAPFVPAVVDGDGEVEPEELLDDETLAAMALAKEDEDATTIVLGVACDDSGVAEGVTATGVDDAGFVAIGGDGVGESEGSGGAREDEGATVDGDGEAATDDPPTILNSGLIFPESPMTIRMLVSMLMRSETKNRTYAL